MCQPFSKTNGGFCEWKWSHNAHCNRFKILQIYVWSFINDAIQPNCHFVISFIFFCGYSQMKSDSIPDNSYSKKVNSNGHIIWMQDSFQQPLEVRDRVKSHKVQWYVITPIISISLTLCIVTYHLLNAPCSFLHSHAINKFQHFLNQRLCIISMANNHLLHCQRHFRWK